jgi:hypothetical protein
MSQKNGEKNGSAKEVKALISPLSIINDLKLRPYIESFSYSPSNITQQPLGNLLGFLKIRDTSEDSAYIVNFLTSVIKKEYYINPKRFVENSFDSALHKANVALSELAKNGNINWLGTIDGAVCVLEKNNFHFSVSGEAKILLLRDKLLTEISEGLAENEEDPNPLKTFVNVSYGQLLSGDKIIITSDDLFRVFSFNEIKKNAERFAGEKFVQFLHTALVNELEAAETIIIDVEEVEKIKKKKVKEQSEELFNVFSGKAFEEPVYSKPKEPAAEESKPGRDFVDEKTGHIYVQQEEGSGRREGRLYSYWLLFAELLGDLYFWLKEKLRKLLFLSRQKLKNTISKGAQSPGSGAIRTEVAPEKSPPFFSSIASRLKNFTNAAQNLPGKLSKTLPDLSKMRKIFSLLSREQRLYGIVVLLAIIVLPFLYIRAKSKKEVPAPIQEEVQIKSQREILASEKNIDLNAVSSVIDASGQGLAAVYLNDSIFTITKKSVIEWPGGENRNEFPLVGVDGGVIAATAMEDLKLILLFTDQKKIISFSPVTHDFKINSIPIPDNTDISTLGTYLTYLYLVDNSNNQIYRYPRAEGGFGTKVNWLKDELALSSVTDMAIDENIYLASGNTLIKLFRGKQESFSIEQSLTPINFKRVFTTGDTDKIYVLDSINSRLIVFGKDGMIQHQYYNELLQNASRFTVDYKNNKAYIITAEGNTAVIGL